MTSAAAHAPTRALLAGFAAVVVLLAVVLATGDIRWRNVHAATESVKQCEELELTLQRLLTTMVDAEAGQRGFIISGAPRYLEPFDHARMQTARHLALVRTIVGDSRDDQADLHRISAAVQAKLEELGRIVDVRRQPGFDTAEAVRITDAGKQTLDELRAIVARMHARETSLLAARSADADTFLRSARVTWLVGLALAMAAIATLFAMVARHEAELRRQVLEADAEQARLRDVLRQQDDFVAVVSHELRTPTTAIVGRARMLERNHMEQDRAAEAIAAIARNADSLRHLIDDLTDATQLVSGRMRLTIGPVDWPRVISEAVDAVRLSAEDKGITLIDELEPELPVLIGDSDRLKQVVWNLLANSIKFTPAGGMVHLAVKRVDDSIALEVRDSGQGIPPSFLPHVFDRFRQGPAAGARGGVGLGLAIVRHIVELHGGQVTVQSEGVNRGATFVVDLPTSAAAVDMNMGSSMFEA
jgi:signal transduction histidine kinase